MATLATGLPATALTGLDLQETLAKTRHTLPVIFLPVQPVGISTEHIDYPGTKTLPTEVALKDWAEIGKSVAQHGIRKLVIVTSHGGNSAAMSLVLVSMPFFVKYTLKIPSSQSQVCQIRRQCEIELAIQRLFHHYCQRLLAK